MEIINTLLHPTEILALVIYKLQRMTSTRFAKNDEDYTSPEMKKCFYYLDISTERYSVAIRSLDGELRDAFCIYYLVGRSLDGIEDDVTISKEEKLRLLPEFYRFLENPSWIYTRGKDKNAFLLEDFKTISSQYRRLKTSFKAVISDTYARIGAGMAEHLNKAPDVIEEWEDYGFRIYTNFFIGISQLFSASETDSTRFDEDKNVFRWMGYFQMKVDYIRDYYEDMLEGRTFWPREIWGKYVKEFSELSHPKKIREALSCLNELVAHSLKHIPDVLKYLDRIKNQPIFEFLALLQLSSIATLERCYNNQQLFRAVINIRKGEKAYLMMTAKNINNVKALFSYYLKKIEQRIPDKDPSAGVTRSAVKRALSFCSVSEVHSVNKIYLAPCVIFAIFLVLIVILF